MTEDRIRIDKWLWQARFFKTRSLAASVVSSGHLRLNGVKMAKPGHDVRPGDVLTFPQADHIRVVRVLAPGTRRGPAEEARTLYADLDGGAKNADPPQPGGAE
ncbi:MAG TPA: RNA-binding S4 domain-containing protein [Albidovulum sp.]|uniref:RNA-binding S4 domain-containing protein n=1 Tax=Albidovulum sp. TaxID=1872424 RepID=UPI002C9BB2A9|nr:RNA-binding S4 domain-containing protein [Pseudomonadota bacterium]HQU70304.1 RNA-binding S4 domain-containing protein [Albidovulum sp.]